MILERRRVSLPAGEIAYVDMGDGPAVLLLHGFPTSADLWHRVGPLLASRMRVLAPDLLGYGLSEKPLGVDLSPLAQAGYASRFLDSLGIADQLAVVGHDIGGAVAQLLALEGRVKTLVLIDSACFDAWPSAWVKVLQSSSSVDPTDEFVEDKVRVALGRGIANKRYVDERLVEAFVRPWVEDPEAFLRAARAIDGVGLAGRESQIGSLEPDTFIIWGEEDPYMESSLGERLGELIPGSTVALLPGCSHYITEDAPQTVGPMVFEYLRYRYLGEAHSHGQGGPIQVHLERP